MILDHTVKIWYENERGFSVPLVPFVANPFQSIYYLLEGTENSINQVFSDQQISWHGESFHNMYMKPRAIDLDGFIMWDSSNPDLIHQYTRQLNRTFNPTRKGSLYYKREGNDNTFFIDGCIVEELPRLTISDGVLKYKITLRCLMPFWRLKTQTEYLSFTQKNCFFPFSIRPTLYIPRMDGQEIRPIEPRQYFGIRRNNLSTVITNIGDVETGFKVVFLAQSDDIRNPSFSNLDTGETIKLTGNPGDFVMNKGDRVEITSMPERVDIRLNEGARGFRNLDPQNNQFFFLPEGRVTIGFNADQNVTMLDVLLYYSPLFITSEGGRA